MTIGSAQRQELISRLDDALVAEGAKGPSGSGKSWSEVTIDALMPELEAGLYFLALQHRIREHMSDPAYRLLDQMSKNL